MGLMQKGKKIISKFRSTSEPTIYIGDDTFAYLTHAGKYSWIKRHRLHRRFKKALKSAERVVTPNLDVAQQVERYYYTPKEKITIQDKKLN